MSDWIRELQQAFRALIRTPGFIILAVGSLGLAIGANAGIFSVVDTVLLKPLPVEAQDRLVYIAGTAPGTDMPDEFPLAIEFFLKFRDESNLIEAISTYNSFTSTLRVEDRTERIRMSAPTISMFDTLGVRPVLGRLPVPEDDDKVAVISHRLWATWFGSDPNVVGQTHYISGEDRTIVGVMAEDFWFPSDGTLLWFPNVIDEADLQPGRFGQRFVARVAPGTKTEALAAELTTLARQLPEQYGGSPNYKETIQQFQPVIHSLEEELLGNVSSALWVLLGSMGILLMIACANVANLFMVRAERRYPELALRRALGAPRGRLIFSQLAEATVIAGLAGGLAVVLAWAGVPLLLNAAPSYLPRLGEVALTPSTLLFTFGICAFSALLCGMAPAIRFSAPSLGGLREGGRGTIKRFNLGRNALVAGQTALALMMLIGSALLMKSFEKLSNVDPGYDTENVFTFQIAPEGADLTDAPSYARFHTDFMKRVAALPGVERVGIVENVPLNEGLNTDRVITRDQIGQEDAGTLVSFTWTAGDYFRTMGIEVFQGRTFTEADHTTQLGNVLVSRSAAEMLWPGRDPIGQTLQINGQETWETVVGVVDDVRQYGFREPTEPMVYLSLVGQEPERRRTLSSPGYVVKTPRADVIASDIRALVRQVAPNAPMYRIYTMEGLAAESMEQLSFTMLTLGIASILALILGLVGLYGVLSYAVAERTREIGVRMALGAAASRVRFMIVSQGVRVLAVGLLIGTAFAFFATRALGGLLFGVAAFDISTYLAVSVLMVLVGLAACYLPARRASNVDPMVSLRAE